MSSSRISWIDIARGIGITLMVYGHTSRGMVKAGMDFEGSAAIDTIIYSFHMPLFFALSGYFFKKSVVRGARNYVFTKVATILYPYLIWSLIQTLIQFALTNLINGDVSWNEVMTFYYPRGQYWFLFALFIIDLLNLAMFNALKESGLILSTVLSVVAIVFQVDLGLLNLALYNIVFFNFGILLSYPLSMNSKLLSNNSMGAVFVSFVALEILNLVYGLSPGVLIILSLLGTTAVIQLSMRISNSHIADLGQNSMPIFLMHTIVSAAIRIILQKFLGIESIVVHLVLGCIGGIYIPFLLYKYLLAKRFGFLFAYPARS
jgi:fucose 4-O-acetylase-like acetyltransferase